MNVLSPEEGDKFTVNGVTATVVNVVQDSSAWEFDEGTTQEQKEAWFDGMSAAVSEAMQMHTPWSLRT